MHRDPTSNPHANRADLRIHPIVFNPNSDPARNTISRDIKAIERIDHPALERMDEAADILAALLQVEHNVANALAGTMIGIASAAPGNIDRKALRIGQLGRVRAGACGVERRMLQQPYELAG